MNLVKPGGADWFLTSDYNIITMQFMMKSGSGLSFDWDPRKALANASKHGVSFEEARTVFIDEDALLIHDPDHSEEEDRFILLGLSYKLRLIVVCHSERKDVVRIISARKATRSEQKQYQERKGK